MKVRYNVSNFLFFVFIFSVSCFNRNSTISIDGVTMGTTYSIKITDFNNRIFHFDQIRMKIDSTLKLINNQMSTYIPSSEISIFNQKDTISILPSIEFLSVLEYAKKLSSATNGSFDITVGPLVQLWGFGDRSDTWSPPQQSKINKLVESIGNESWDMIDGKLIKLNKNIQIDLNAIAKGFAVDILSKLIESFGFMNYMVEIGGEVYCAGMNQNGVPWKIGIELPNFDSRTFDKIVNLTNVGMATSGDYRNYFSYNGKKYSHTINPKTGKPIEHALASATVISHSCMDADGLATALLVMGTVDALNFIEGKSEVECILIEREKNGEYKTSMSSGFDDFLSD